MDDAFAGSWTALICNPCSPLRIRTDEGSPVYPGQRWEFRSGPDPLSQLAIAATRRRYAIQLEWADLRRLPRPIRNLTERIRTSLDLYPCDLLFVHRDAEKISYERRVIEIERALRAVPEWEGGRTIGVVPVRMTEAWLLVDEAALRRAAGNPNGQQPLALPPVDQLEQIPDPKTVLDELLKVASGLRGRRLKSFGIRVRMSRIAEFMQDFSSLRALHAFQELERGIERAASEHGWSDSP